MKRVVGYTDPLSVAPGGTVRAYVSCDPPAAEVELSVVRMLAGDPAPGSPALRYTDVYTEVNGRYSAFPQAIHPGSYASVPGCSIGASNQIALQVNFKPTLVRSSNQVLICWGNPWAGDGIALYLDEHLRPAIAASGKAGPTTGFVQRVLRLETWYRLSATIQLPGRVEIRLSDLTAGSKPDSHVFDLPDGLAISSGPRGLFLAAAPAGEDGAARPQDVRWHFNGLLERPAIVKDRDLTDEDRRRLGDPADDRIAADLANGLVGLWDFSAGTSTWHIADQGPSRLSGQLFNLPRRAVCGSNWDGVVVEWRQAPHMFGAIHFLADAVGDCGWKAMCELEIPASFRSGFYAFRIVAGDEVEFLPFFVRPPQHKAHARIGLLVPTATYLSYANSRFWWEDPIQEAVSDRLVEIGPEDEWVLNHPEVGPSCYDRYTDMTDVCYGSRLRPNLSMRPGHLRHEGYVSDLYLVEWLEHHGHAYDVFTDEDLDREGLELIRAYDVVLTGTHPEYVSVEEWDALRAYRDSGGRIMYLGGNGFHTRVSFDRERPWIMENRRTFAWFNTRPTAQAEHYFSLDGNIGGYLANVSRPPHDLVGVDSVTMGFDESRPYLRGPGGHDPRAAFVFDGIDSETIGDFGVILGGAVGQEWDNADGFVHPPGHIILASSANHSLMPSLFGAERKPYHADLVLLLCPGGGAVFSASSMAWCGSLSHNLFRNNVSRMMSNVLSRFLDPQPIVDG